MALALNNLKIVDMPLNKETKPNLLYHSDCSGYDTNPSDGEAPRALGNVKYLLTAITSSSTLIWSGSKC